MSQPSYTTFWGHLTVSPDLEYLKLDNVYPKLAHEIDYGEINMPSLKTVDIVMNDTRVHVTTIFVIFSASTIRTLSFKSNSLTILESFKHTLLILEVTLANIHSLRLSMTMKSTSPKLGVVSEFFGEFLDLDILSLVVPSDANTMYFLRS
jgi:hypothetical protein